MTWLFQLGIWLQDNLVKSVGLASPFCPLYLVPAICLSWLWLCRSQNWNRYQVWRYTQAKVNQHRRTLQSDALWTMLQLGLLRMPVALFHLFLFHWAYDGLISIGGERFDGWQAPEVLEGLLATAVTMLTIDLAAYMMHRAMHSHVGLWWIHRLHHQTQFLSPLATFRQHPLEPFLLNGARGLAAGLSLGAVHLLFPSSTPVWTVAGMGLGFFLYMFTINLHHAPIPIRYPAGLSLFLISPHIHHIHHSKAAEHHGKNFGVVFSIWDRMFGSYLDQKLNLDELEFGVDA